MTRAARRVPGVEVTGRSGPAHAPRFTVEVYARFLDAREVRTGPHAGWSKREALDATARARCAHRSLRGRPISERRRHMLPFGVDSEWCYRWA